MTETSKRKNHIAKRSKRAGRKQLAEPAPPTTTSAPTSSPPLPLRTRSEPQLDQPPRYSVLFPPDQIRLPQRPGQSLHAPSHTALQNPSSLPPQQATSNVLQTTSSNANSAGQVINAERPVHNTIIEPQRASPEAVAQEVLRDLISTKFDSVITSIDGEQFGGDEQELEIPDDVHSGIRGGGGIGSRQVSQGANRAISTAVVGTNYFAKANLYANSRLPPNLPALQL